MSVTFVTVTPDAEKIMGYVARVSNPNNQDNPAVEKLLAYCVKHQHWSVFETAYMTLEMQTSRAISAQILRHRSFTFQEFSQRYATATDFVLYDARRQDQKNRQNSTDDLPTDDKEWFFEAQEDVQAFASQKYAEALERGIAKECARFLLPMGTATKIYVTGNVRSWIHYIELRTTPGTQKEHRDLALEARQIFIQQFPTVAKALEWNDIA